MAQLPKPRQVVTVQGSHVGPAGMTGQPLVDAIGASQVVFGSDYPHSEGVAEPIQFAESLEGFDADTTRQIMRDNARDLLGLAPGEGAAPTR